MAENFDFLYPIEAIIDGGITAKIHDEDGDENNVLDAARHSSIMIRWHLENSLPHYLSPDSWWRVEARFEQIGGGEGPTLPPVYVRYGLNPPGPIFWHTQIPIPAGTMPPSPYKVVVLVDWEWPQGTPSRMSGFAEIPMVKFH